MSKTGIRRPGGKARDHKPGGYKVVCLSFYREDLALLDAAAASAQMNRSEFVRAVVRAFAGSGSNVRTVVTTTIEIPPPERTQTA
jgi:hypothetical protein